MSGGFEKKMEKLEAIVSSMEGGELALDESLKLFEEGVKISRQCSEHLNKAEEKVRILLEVSEEGEAVTEEFSEK